MMHAPSEAKTTKKTTGWSEETRNIFHPGDIITALSGGVWYEKEQGGLFKLT